MASVATGSGYETVIGLEIHVQLQTRTKLFCGCAPRFGDPANVHTCPVCLGLPGALPVPNERAVEYALRAAVALGCEVAPRSRFARKNYFYPDLPKGYQISQYEEPLARGGRLRFDVDGRRREVGIVRLHLEEDAGKSVHDDLPDGGSRTLVDLNRCGTPLIEVVTAPDLRSVGEADAFLQSLRTLLLYLEITDASMEEGSLRCDANVSVRPAGQEELPPKTELKNLNSFRFLRRALRYEERRQRRELETGGRLTHSTRLWDEAADRSVPMRTKEEAHDYRYFPEPDLVPLVLEEGEVERLHGSLPELPRQRAERFVAEYGLPPQDAAVLVEERGRADYFEAVVEEGVEPRLAGNWVRGEVLRVLNERGWSLAELGAESGAGVDPVALAGLLRELESERVSAAIAKRVFDRMVETGRRAADIIEAEGLEQIGDPDRVDTVVDGVLETHPDEVASYREGNDKVLGFLMGQVMRATGGKVDPQLARQTLLRKLAP